MGRRKQGLICLIQRYQLGFDLELLNKQMGHQQHTVDLVSHNSKVSRGSVYDFLKGRQYKKSKSYAKIKQWFLDNGYSSCLVQKDRLRKLNKVAFAVHKVTKQVLTNPKVYAKPTAIQKKEWKENAIIFNENPEVNNGITA